MYHPPRYTTVDVAINILAIVLLGASVFNGLTRLAEGELHGIVPWIGLACLIWVMSRSVRRIAKFYGDQRKAVDPQREVDRLEQLYRAPDARRDN